MTWSPLQLSRADTPARTPDEHRSRGFCWDDEVRNGTTSNDRS